MLKSDLDLRLVQDYQDLLEALGLDLYSLVQVYLEAQNFLMGLQQHKETLLTPGLIFRWISR